MAATDEKGPGGDAVKPDTKDWTWTLERRCPDCGFDAGAVPGEQVASRTLELTRPWPEVLRRESVRHRPAPGVWSPLEYACHVRDVCRVFEGRARLMLDVDEPRFPDWNQDETALQERYGEQDPEVVDRELAHSAAAVAEVFDGVRGEQWGRSGIRSNGSRFTVLTLGQYFLHDLAHHIVDVGAEVRPSGGAGR